MHQYITANAYGQHTRYEQFQGRQYLVAPVVMLTESIHNGSGGPLYYPRDELAKTPEAWNMKPVVVYHPQHGTATTPVELAARMVGMVMNTRWSGGKLRAEVWIDTDRLTELAPEVGEALMNNETVEVSTGLFTDNEYAPGTLNGKDYEFVARNHRPDHLALLPTGVGACSVADGCGLLQLNQHEETTMHQHHENELPLPTMNFGKTCGCATPRGGDDDDRLLPLPTMNYGQPCAQTNNNYVHRGGDGEIGLPLPTTI